MPEVELADDNRTKKEPPSENVLKDYLLEESSSSKNADKAAGVEDSTSVSQGGEASDIELEKDDEAPRDSSAPIWRRVPKAAIAIMGVVVAAVIVFAVLAVTGTVASTPQLSDEQVVETVQQHDWSTEHLTNSEWGANDGYSVESTEVLSNEKEPRLSVDDPEMRCARVQIVLSNSSFRVTVVSGEYFRRLEDNSWEHFDTVIESVSPEPIGPIDNERLLASVPTFLGKVDDADKGKHDADLLDLYGEGASFEIVSNDTGAQGGSVQIKLSRDAGLYSCAGTLTVDFTYSNGDWAEASCTVDEAAYQKDYSAMIGEHPMTLVESLGKGGKRCYGARSIPASLNVKSYDSSGNTITADIMFAVHSHSRPENSVESSEGDLSFTAQDVIIKLDFSGWSTEVFERKDVVAATDVSVFLVMKENSSVAELTVCSYHFPRGRVNEVERFEDQYIVDFAK